MESMLQSTVLGSPPKEDHKRDAIHIPVLPVTVGGEALYPGQQIYVRDGVAFHAVPGIVAQGIVDPFLSGIAVSGSRVWVLLMPGSVKGMTHHWSADGFADGDIVSNGSAEEEEMEESQRFMEKFAEKLRITYEEVLEAGDNYIKNDDYHVLGFDTPSVVYEEGEEYWKHWSIIRGQPVPKKNAPWNSSAPFSCAC